MIRTKIAFFIAPILISTNSLAIERIGEESLDYEITPPDVRIVVVPPDGTRKLLGFDNFISGILEAGTESDPNIGFKKLEDRGWNGAISYIVDAEDAETVRSLFEERLRTNSLLGDEGVRVRIDKIRFPADVDTPTVQWMYDEPSSDPGSGNIRPVFSKVDGANVTVAVLDTGKTLHPDLVANTLSGYDFITSPFVANDGNDTRDSDPTDTGDFILPGECKSPKFEASSWHGSHVQGTIAGQANSKGYRGVAPGAKIVPIRVLGRCGGSDQDIQDAVSWAMGEPVDGVPVNPNPAQIINMSIGTAEKEACRGGSGNLNRFDKWFFRSRSA